MKHPAPAYRRSSSIAATRTNDQLVPLQDLWPPTASDNSGTTKIATVSCRFGPIANLPAELLAQVFEHCLSEDIFPAPAVSQAPLVLAHTCSHWRAVALSTPSLWSRLHITYKDPLLDVPSASGWLQRSGTLPLSISLFIDFNEQPAQEILDVICAHSPRWRHVRFEFRGLYCPPMYSLALAENVVPLLRAFEFDARDISSANITPVISLLNSAPTLREVTWVDDLADTRRLLELPLSRLTLLSITMSQGTLDYLELLDQCYNLEHVRINRPRQGGTRPPREPLVLSKLTSLNIAYDLTALLDSLVLPALKHVRIHSEGQTGRNTGLGATTGAGIVGGHGSGTWSPVSFLSLIERSSCTIDSLWVDAPMTESCLAECLEKTANSLTKLTIASVCVANDLLSRLTCSPSPRASPPPSEDTSFSFLPTSSIQYPPALSPLLQELHFDTRLSSTPGTLLGMVESRLILMNDMDTFFLRVWDGHTDLESLRLLRDRHRLPSGLSRFRLDVINPPRDILSSNSPGFPSKPRARRYLSARRRACQSR